MAGSASHSGHGFLQSVSLPRIIGQISWTEEMQNLQNGHQVRQIPAILHQPDLERIHLQPGGTQVGKTAQGHVPVILLESSHPAGGVPDPRPSHKIPRHSQADSGGGQSRESELRLSMPDRGCDHELLLPKAFRSDGCSRLQVSAHVGFTRLPSSLTMAGLFPGNL